MENSYILKTSNIYNQTEAIDWKMKQIHPKLLGLFCPVSYRLISSEEVYVPYMFLVFDYRLIRSTKQSKLHVNRQGQIGIVFDMNEVHAFHYDLFDDLNLIKTQRKEVECRFIEARCTKQDAIEQSIECVKWQYLRKVFHAVPEITLASKQLFFREAVKLNLECRGKQYEKFAYMDKFGTKNEHISGLRVRLDI